MQTSSNFTLKASKAFITTATQEVKGEGGGNNLVVDGSGKGTITTEADETVILIAEGDDAVFVDSDFNYIETQAGNNKIDVTGSENTMLTDNGDNDIDVRGSQNTIITDNGDNDIDVTGSGNEIFTDNGDNTITLKGNYNKTNTNNGNNAITSTGSNNYFKMINGNNTLKSFGSHNNIFGNNSSTLNTIYSFGDDNTIETDNGDSKIYSGGNNNTIITDNGDNTIISGGYKKNGSSYTITGKGNNNYISAGRGTNNIKSTGDNNEIYGGSGQDIIETTGNNNTVDAGDGTNKITSKGDDNKLYGGKGKDTIITTGNNNEVEAGDGNNWITSNGDHNTLKGGNGKDIVTSIGNNNKIDTKDGTDAILSLGDDVEITSGNGDKRIVFEGDNIDITAKDGNHDIYTLDFAIANNLNKGYYDQYVDYLKDNTYTRIAEKNVLISTDSYWVDLPKEVSYSSTNYPADVLDKLGYFDKQYLESHSIDWNEKTKDGKNKYVIAKGKSDGQYHIYEHSSGNTYKAVAGFKANGTTRDYSKVASGNGYLYVNGNTTYSDGGTTTTTTTTTTKRQLVTEKRYADKQETVIDGNKGVKIKVGNGYNNMFLNVKEDAEIEAGDNKTSKTNNIFVTGEIITDEEYVNYHNGSKEYGEIETKTTTATDTTKTPISSATIVGGSYSTSSPLIVDFNRDGEVSAISGKGIDVDNNGISDGAATGGDKMLAMSDMNGNGYIDGGEVFGDKTISPFTKQPLNAANGFEALKMIAEQAKEYTGIDCIQKGEVNLEKLQKALKTVGVNLGFISDGNMTELEGFGHVVSINVEEYTEQDVTGEVQHRQLGSYTDNEGKKYKTDDVWFRNY